MYVCTSLHSIGYLSRPKDRRNLLNFLNFGLTAKKDLQTTLTSCGRLGTKNDELGRS